jgi:hypothetical protein
MPVLTLRDARDYWIDVNFSHGEILLLFYPGREILFFTVFLLSFIFKKPIYAIATALQYKDCIFSLRYKFRQVYPITQTKYQKKVLLTYHEVKFYLTVIPALCPKIYVQNRYVQINDIRLEVLVICT